MDHRRARPEGEWIKVNKTGDDIFAISKFSRFASLTQKHIVNLTLNVYVNKESATAKLLELKEQINNDPEKFAEAAKEFSSCRTSKDGGNLGEPFGPGVMVKQVDDVCFEKEVGVVHGPISSPYGEHLILLSERFGDE